MFDIFLLHLHMYRVLAIIRQFVNEAGQQLTQICKLNIQGFAL
jgi:hypothetical protein